MQLDHDTKPVSAKAQVRWHSVAKRITGSASRDIILLR
jgi:hypothetical protein